MYKYLCIKLTKKGVYTKYAFIHGYFIKLMIVYVGWNIKNIHDKKQKKQKTTLKLISLMGFPQ